MSTRRLYGDVESDDRLATAFRNGTIPVAVYGLGKMGLPLATVFAGVTGDVTGVDVDPEVVEAVERGDCPVEGEPGLSTELGDVVRTGALTVTTDGAAAAAGARVHVVIVPTLLKADAEPDLSNLEAALTDVAAGLDPGDVVFVESTVPPHTCREVVRPLLAAESGLDPNEFGVAFCPERTSSGRALRDIRGAYPKVVGGVDPESTRVAEALYGTVNANGVVPVADAATAECVKVFEGVYRDVNIALANELGRFTDELGVDVREAIDAANTQPYCDIHDPGPGVGGHCIPYYPYFLLDGFETDAPLVRTAREVNEAMPGFVVSKLAEELAAEGLSVDDATVLVLGLTYRPGVAETRESPARPIAERLTRLGADVYGVDPLLDAAGAGDFAADLVSRSAAADLDPDAAVVVTPHEEFEAFDWDAFDPMVVVDGRGSLDAAALDHRVYTIGGG